MLNIRQIIHNCFYPGLEFVYKEKDSYNYLQIKGKVLDSAILELKEFSGRKWLISKHMTESEIVQTVFKAVLTWVEHETRENFKYKDTIVFNPHLDVKQKLDVR